MAELHRWTAQVGGELDISPEVLAAGTDPILDVVRVIAHGVNRPSAPLTAFLIGLAAGRAGAGQDDAQQSAAVLATVAKVEALAKAWQVAEE